MEESYVLFTMDAISGVCVDLGIWIGVLLWLVGMAVPGIGPCGSVREHRGFHGERRWQGEGQILAAAAD